MTTIFALSSGHPPSGVAVVRITGEGAFAALALLTGAHLPPMRTMVLRELRDENAELLDRGLVVRFAGPASVTGEDVVELHLHGSVAVAAAVFRALAALGLTAARPGEFTRRAFDNGKLDLGQVEAFGDLIAAETDGQRRAALERTGGSLSRAVESWRATLLGVRADLEATLDFAEEDDVPAELPHAAARALRNLADALAKAVADGHRGSLINNGVTVAIVGPVNAGKSTLLNALARRDAAMVSPVPGTTRDVIEVRAVIAGQLVVIIDTAGLRDTVDALELEGIRRGVARAANADVVVDLGRVAAAGTIAVAAQSDRDGRPAGWRDGVLHLSALTGEGIDLLEAELAARVARLVRPGEVPIVANARQIAILEQAQALVVEAAAGHDAILVAENLRSAAAALATLIGRMTNDDVLDEIFGRFCVGK